MIERTPKIEEFKDKQVVIKDLPHTTGYTFKSMQDADSAVHTADFGVIRIFAPKSVYLELIRGLFQYELRPATKEEQSRTLTGMEQYLENNKRLREKDSRGTLGGLEQREANAAKRKADLTSYNGYREHYYEEPKKAKSGIWEFLTGFFVGYHI